MFSWKVVCLGVNGDEEIKVGIPNSWLIGYGKDRSNPLHKGNSFFLQSE